MGPWLEKARRNKRAASIKKRERGRGGGLKITEQRDKGNSEAEKLCFFLIQCQSKRDAR